MTVRASILTPSVARCIVVTCAAAFFASGGVFKGTDGGNSWRASGGGLPEGVGVGILAIDPNMPGALYAGTDDGVFRSTDGGNSWGAASTDSPATPFVAALALDPPAPANRATDAKGNRP